MTLLRGNILIVDDTKLNRILLAGHLQQDGHTVAIAEHGRRAMEMLYAQSFDVVLLDLLMPEMDGFQVLAQMKADPTLRHIPVIVISALDEMESVVRCIEMGATDHLNRPFDPVLLRARLNASLAAKRLHDQETEYLRQVTYLTNAAAEVEAGTFAPASLANVAVRSDALGKLARVFQQMAREVYAREQHLKEQNQFKSSLISKITHELRSPFAAAGLSVQLLQRYASLDMGAEIREQIQCLDQQLAEGRRQIDNIIAFASLVGKQIQPRRQETDVAALIGRVIAPLRTLAETHSVSIESNFGAGLPIVQADPELLHEAIHHLVHNAIKFNHEGGRVAVACWPSGAQLVFRVEDTGPGIDPERLALIWEAFVQVADDTRRGVEGLGLGLALVKSIVEAHGGDVIVRSHLNQGSIFGFRIPIS